MRMSLPLLHGAAVQVLFTSSLLLVFQCLSAQEGLAKVSPHVYAYTGIRDFTPQNSFAANAGVIVGDDSALVVDTLISAKEAKRLIKDIRAVTGKPIKYVVNTHYHLDHSLGNSEFAKLGALIIGQERDRLIEVDKGDALLAQAKGSGLSDADLEGTVVVPPSVGFADRMSLNLGGLEVQLVYPGPTHSPGSSYVLVPSEKVIFTGDILFTGVHPFLGEGDIPNWCATLDAFSKMDLAVIVPGHGPLSTKRDFADMRDYLLLFDAKAKEFCLKSKDLDQVALELQKILPERRGFALIKMNLRLRYLSNE